MTMHKPIGPVDATKVPRYAGLGTFARLPQIDRVPDYDIAIVGVPFDGGTSFRPGARFGPAAVREASRLLRPGYHPELDVEPVYEAQVVDAGDIACTPYDISRAVREIEEQALPLISEDKRLISIGGDHTIALPMLRALNKVHGPVALLHFDAHLDTWDTYFDQPVTHGTIFRRAFEEGLLVEDKSMHVGIRGPVYDRNDFLRDHEFGFQIIRCSDLDVIGVPAAIQRVKDRLGDTPVYVSIDIDVLDPAYAPGTGTPGDGRAPLPRTPGSAPRAERHQHCGRRRRGGRSGLRPCGHHHRRRRHPGLRPSRADGEPQQGPPPLSVNCKQPPGPHHEHHQSLP